MRQNYGDAAAYHSKRNATRTYQHQQLARTEQREQQNQSRTSRSVEGGDGVSRGARVQDARLTGCTSHRFRAVGTAQPKTYLPERTEEGRAGGTG